MSHLDGCKRCASLLTEIEGMRADRDMARLERDASRTNASNAEHALHAVRREMQALRQDHAVGTDRIDLHPTPIIELDP